MQWTVADSNRFYFSHSHRQSFQVQVLAPNFMISLLKIPSTQSCLHQSLYKGVSPFPKCSLFPPSLTYNVTKERAPFKKHSDESRSLFLSYPALTQETQTIFLPFINQTCLCLQTIAYWSHPPPTPYFPISSSKFSLVTLCLSSFLPSLNSYWSYWLDHAPSIPTGISTPSLKLHPFSCLGA